MRSTDPPPISKRDALFYALVTEGTRFMELALGLSMLCDGFLVLINEQGHSAVPFLASSLNSLVWPQWAWAVALCVVGILTLHGWYASFATSWRRIRCGEKPPPYRMQEIVHEPHLFSRAAFMTLQAVLWAVVTAAITTGPPPVLVSLRYGRSLLISSVCAVMLWMQWSYARKWRSTEVDDNDVEAVAAPEGVAHADTQ